MFFCGDVKIRDHSQGNMHMAEVLGSGGQIIGGVNDGSPAVTREVGDGDIVEVGSLKVCVEADMPLLWHALTGARLICRKNYR